MVLLKKTGFIRLLQANAGGGRQRWRGLTEIPAVIVDADDRKAAELAIIENIQRKISIQSRKRRHIKRLPKSII